MSDSLDRDTAVLEALLGDVLEEQEGRAFRDRVFWLRDTAARVRGGDDRRQPGRWPGSSTPRPTPALEPFVRACSIQLQLANIAEELERLRRRRHYDSDASAPQRESLAAAAGVAVQHPPAEVAEALRRLDVRLTMTAHPTEATRRSVFNHQQSVWRAMERLDDPRLGRTQRRELEGELREVLTVWWQTDAVRRMRPVVEDEVRRILFFFEAVLFDAAPRLEAEISRSFERSWPPSVPAVRFGSWAGGDMDGNPEVTPDSVVRTLRPAPHDRAAAAASAGGQARRAVLPIGGAAVRLARRSRPRSSPTARKCPTWPPAGRATSRSRFAASCRSCRRGSTARCAGCRTVTVSPGSSSDDLELLRESSSSRRVADGALARLLCQVRTFGFHLAALDVRLSAHDLRSAIEPLAVGFAAAPEDERTSLTRRSARGRRRRALRTCSRRSRPVCASTARRRSAA